MTLNPKELDRLVAQSGGEILARVRGAEPVCRTCAGSCSEGCAQRSAQVVAASGRNFGTFFRSNPGFPGA